MARVKVVAPDRILVPGKSNLDRCDNKVVSARYTALTFFPVVRVSLRSIRAVLLLLLRGLCCAKVAAYLVFCVVWN